MTRHLPRKRTKADAERALVLNLAMADQDKLRGLDVDALVRVYGLPAAKVAGLVLRAQLRGSV